MNKKLIWIFIVFIFFGLIPVNSYAQSTNNEQHLIGTWINNADNSRVVINSNGTITGLYWEGSRLEKFAAAGEKIILYIEDDNDYVLSGDFRISTDGRTLIIIATIGMLGIPNQIAFSFRRN